jgi:glutamate synthase (NADPH) small chain
VTVYDRYDRAGGLMTYGIPSFKLEKDIVMRRIDQLEQGGVEFVLNCNVGEDLSFDAIRGKHDAVLIATGVYKTRELSGENAGAEGIVRAIDYLTASNKVSFGDYVEEFATGELNAAGKKVVVIGGGDTAMDCVRTAIRQGAESVKCLYRRDRANMPGSQREVANAEEEGVEFVWLSAPVGFTTGVIEPEGAGAASGIVRGATVQRMRLGAPDTSGRQSPEVIDGSDYTEDADLVIKALGFEPEDLPKLWNTEGLDVTRWGTVRAEFGSGRTSLDGVYAVGDIVRGASLVVWAIRDGRDCAAAILEDLQTADAIAAE